MHCQSHDMQYVPIATAKRKAEAFFPPFHRDLFFDYFRFRIQIQYSGSFILCFILSLKVRILIWHALKFVRSHTFQHRSIVVSPELEPLIVKLPVIHLKSLSRQKMSKFNYFINIWANCNHKET
jgi:hypothetical protein